MYREHEEEVLWDTVTILKDQNRYENALVLFKSLIERTFSALRLPTSFLDEVKIELPSTEYMIRIRTQDKMIYESLKSKDMMGAYENLVDYIEKLSEVFPEADQKKILAQIIADQTQIRMESVISSSTATIPLQEEVDYVNSYSTLEAAEIIGVSDQTIRRWCEDGKYPSARKTSGNRWRIPKEYFKITLEEARKRKAFEQQLNKFNAGHGEGDEDEFL
ncbi:helix-turn-helix domain-containing protein [Lederbergia graminis]|uniref:Helix-turn-helix domain-containing protein n=1 Tax=Lederbergia graminis TaxID=735518 RepID=A0ABW0LJ31_9BACI